jgi:Ca2+-binding EF-hand superfamily protein
MRAWFALDPEENMRLGEQTFTRRCLELGFRGDVRALWQYADSDRSGHISILELDTKSAVLLATFKKFVHDKWNGAVGAFRAMDTNKSGRLGKMEFCNALKYFQYTGPSSRLFELLDRRGFGHMVSSDMDFFDHWTPPQYLLSEPDDRGLRALKKACWELCGSYFNAWRNLLDRDSTMRVSWDEFCTACRHLHRDCSAKDSSQHKRVLDIGLPKTEQEIAGVWRALDDDCSGWISLREFDPPVWRAFAAFKRWADETHGGVIRAFHWIDNGNGRVSVSEMRHHARFGGDVDLLFRNLDVDGHGKLTEEEFKFLEHWDLAWEEWEVAIRQHHQARSTGNTSKAGVSGTQQTPAQTTTTG